MVDVAAVTLDALETVEVAEETADAVETVEAAANYLETVALASNLKARCIPVAIERYLPWLLQVQQSPHLHL